MFPAVSKQKGKCIVFSLIFIFLFTTTVFIGQVSAQDYNLDLGADIYFSSIEGQGLGSIIDLEINDLLVRARGEADRENFKGAKLFLGRQFSIGIIADEAYLLGGYGYRRHAGDIEHQGPQVAGLFKNNISEELEARTYLQLGIYPDQYDLHYRVGFNYFISELLSLSLDYAGYTAGEQGLMFGISLDWKGVN